MSIWTIFNKGCRRLHLRAQWRHRTSFIDCQRFVAEVGVEAEQGVLGSASRIHAWQLSTQDTDACGSGAPGYNVLACARARVRACARADGRYWPTLHSVADNAVSSSIMLRIFMRTEPCRGAMVRAAGAQRAQTCGLVPQAGRRRRGVQSRCGEELWVDEFALVHCVCAIKTSADCGGALVWIDTAPRD
jgi:hypothetical protein